MVHYATNGEVCRWWRLKIVQAECSTITLFIQNLGLIKVLLIYLKIHVNVTIYCSQYKLILFYLKPFMIEVNGKMFVT